MCVAANIPAVASSVNNWRGMMFNQTNLVCYCSQMWLLIYKENLSFGGDCKDCGHRSSGWALSLLHLLILEISGQEMTTSSYLHRAVQMQLLGALVQTTVNKRMQWRAKPAWTSPYSCLAIWAHPIAQGESQTLSSALRRAPEEHQSWAITRAVCSSSWLMLQHQSQPHNKVLISTSVSASTGRHPGMLINLTVTSRAGGGTSRAQGMWRRCPESKATSPSGEKQPYEQKGLQKAYWSSCECQVFCSVKPLCIKQLDVQSGHSKKHKPVTQGILP